MYIRCVIIIHVLAEDDFCKVCASGSAVEHLLAKEGVAGSIPVSRSYNNKNDIRLDVFFLLFRAHPVLEGSIFSATVPIVARSISQVLFFLIDIFPNVCLLLTALFGLWLISLYGIPTWMLRPCSRFPKQFLVFQLNDA